jgi:hypothetical protein
MGQERGVGHGVSDGGATWTRGAESEGGIREAGGEGERAKGERGLWPTGQQKAPRGDLGGEGERGTLGGG